MPHPIFTVTAEEIQLLDDAQSRELIARLSREELRRLGGSEAAVTWGGDQRAKDGGVDVRVDAGPSVATSGYVPRIATAYQVKAENFPKSKIVPEMAPGGVLRPAINDLAGTGGAYVIVSTRDNLSDSSRSTRVDEMTDCLKGFGLEGNVALDFFDSRRVADWVEQFPPIVTWVKLAIGRPLAGWRPYGPWAYREQSADADYIVDERVKVFAPNSDEGIDVADAINSLRGDLASRASVRLVGLSGVGKTRLVQALFDDRVKTENDALSASKAIYADLGDNPTPQPTSMIEALLDSGSDACVVIDNCGPELHQRLTDLVKRSESHLSLVTVEYDIRDDLPEGTVCYRLEGASDEVIRQLLRLRYPDLSDNDVEKVTEFSDGNARVAFALANASAQKGELARLADDQLFQRLFLQKHSENDELLRCAEVASLLYSFDAEDMSENSEMALLASLAEASVTSFSRNIVELQKRGLVQQRGKWKAVLPHAIANRLAARALDAFPRSLLASACIDNASDRVARSFSRRIGYLHDSVGASALVQEFLKPGGRISELGVLNEVDRQIFRNIAPVDPTSALAALKAAVQKGEATSKESYVRSDLIRVARSIAYDRTLFDDAFSVLLAFALSEADGRSNQSASDALKSLFYCHLSGTHATISQRVSQVRSLLNSGEERKVQLGLQALQAALEATHFSSHFEFEFGARKRDYGWAPQTWDDVRSWYTPFVEIAVELGAARSELGRELRYLLGRAFRGLWTNAQLADKLEWAAQHLSIGEGWSEGWVGARETLHWDRSRLPENILERLLNVEKLLAPKDLKAAIRGKVLARGAFAIDLVEEQEDDDGDAATRFNKSRSEAEELGKAAGSDADLVEGLLVELLKGKSGDKIYHFGVGLGEVLENPECIFEQARQIVSDTDPSEFSLIVLRGVLSSWSKKDSGTVSKFLDLAVGDEVWGRWFPELQVAAGIGSDGFQRIVKSIELGRAPTWQYRYLSGGRATDPLDVDQIGGLVECISSLADGLPVAIDLLGMVVFSARERGGKFQTALARFCAKFLAVLDWSQLDVNETMIGHHVETILTFFLSHSLDAASETKVLANLLAWERSDQRSYAYGRGKFLKPFFELRPEVALDAVCEPDKDGRYRTAKRLVANRDSDRGERPIAVVPVEALLRWCRVSPDDRFPFVAESCPLFAPEQKSPDGTDGVEKISNVARAVFLEAPDRRVVFNAYVDRLMPMGWSGSRAAEFRRRLAIIDELDAGDDPKLSDFVKAEKERLLGVAANIEAQEQEEERGRSASFE